MNMIIISLPQLDSSDKASSPLPIIFSNLFIYLFSFLLLQLEAMRVRLSRNRKTADLPSEGFCSRLGGSETHSNATQKNKTK